MTARVIPGVALPLLVGMNFRNGHAECPDMQRQVNNLNAPKIFFFQDSKAPTSSITLKHLNRVHRDMDHPDYTQMATECVRLGHKVSKAVELRRVRVIQECQICKGKDRTFSHGHGKKYTSLQHGCTGVKKPRCTFRPEFTESDIRYPLGPGKGSPHTTGGRLSLRDQGPGALFRFT